MSSVSASASAPVSDAVTSSTSSATTASSWCPACELLLDCCTGSVDSRCAATVHDSMTGSQPMQPWLNTSTSSVTC